MQCIEDQGSIRQEFESEAVEGCFSGPITYLFSRVVGADAVLVGFAAGGVGQSVRLVVFV